MCTCALEMVCDWEFSYGVLWKNQSLSIVSWFSIVGLFLNGGVTPLCYTESHESLGWWHPFRKSRERTDTIEYSSIIPHNNTITHWLKILTKCIDLFLQMINIVKLRMIFTEIHTQVIDLHPSLGESSQGHWHMWPYNDILWLFSDILSDSK